jgi:hypothetical protein
MVIDKRITKPAVAQTRLSSAIKALSYSGTSNWPLSGGATRLRHHQRLTARRKSCAHGISRRLREQSANSDRSLFVRLFESLKGTHSREDCGFRIAPRNRWSTAALMPEMTTRSNAW